MSTLVLEVEPSAVRVLVTDDDLIVDLADGRSIHVPLAWIRAYFMALQANGQTGSCSETAMRLNGPTWMSILALKVCWQGGTAVRARHH